MSNTDSTGKPIKIGDSVRWRGKLYTIKAFKEERHPTWGCPYLEFEELLHLSDEEPYEVSVDLVASRTRRPSPSPIAMSPQRGAFGEPRDSQRSIGKAVDKGGAISMPTLTKLLELLAAKTDYPHHIEVSITTGPLIKNLDNERDALETIRRLETA